MFLKLTNSNESLFNVKSTFLSILLSGINLYIISKGITVIRPVIIHVCYVLILYSSYRTTLSKATIAVLVSASLFAVGEMMAGLVFPTFLNINFVEMSNVNEIIIGNIVIFCFVFLILCNKEIKKLLMIIIRWCTENKTFKNIVLAILVIVTLAILFKECILQWDSFPNLILINVFIICILVFVLLYFKENSDRNKLVMQYDKLLGHVQAYEKLIIEKNKDQHEYKNQLIILRELINKNNKKAFDYINELLETNNKEINYNWLTKLNNIPSGGLKGLIYYKISQMQEQGIDVYIDVSKNLGEENIWAICDRHLRDISRVIGVYIDNAIEAATHANKKYIIIEVELIDESIVFSFSNTYAGAVDITNIDTAGFSTKGKGKGYGLSLVKDIINKNNNLSQQKEINGIYYVQRLIIQNV